MHIKGPLLGVYRAHVMMMQRRARAGRGSTQAGLSSLRDIHARGQQLFTSSRG